MAHTRRLKAALAPLLLGLLATPPAFLAANAACTPAKLTDDAAIPVVDDAGADAAPLVTPDGATIPLPPAGSCTDATAGDWLYTNSTKICRGAGPFRARGANLPDTRSCQTCVLESANLNELVRRFDEVVDHWGANLVRLRLESYGADNVVPGVTLVQWKSVLQDPGYLLDLQKLVVHAATRPGVYVMLSLWRDSTLTSSGEPTPQTVQVWKRLAQAFANSPNVIFGVAHEPDRNSDGARDEEIWTNMNNAVKEIRAAEAAAGGGKHLVAVQGLGEGGRRLQYYARRRIDAGNGENVIYETHVFNQQSEFAQVLLEPARYLPVFVGDFGPTDDPNSGSKMSVSDAEALMMQMESMDMPYAAGVFHHKCAPSMLVEQIDAGCGIDMKLEPTTWGGIIQARFKRPWGQK